MGVKRKGNKAQQHSVDQMQIAGKAGQRVMFSATAGGKQLTFIQAWFIHNGKAYVWTFADSSDKFDLHVPSFNQMLETMIVD